LPQEVRTITNAMVRDVKMFLFMMLYFIRK
jgi:hypothetical protein